MKFKVLQPIFLACLLVLLGLGTIQAQTDPTIVQPIENLFKGMKTGDSALVHSSFLNNAVFITIVERDGKTGIRKEELGGFLKAIGTPHPDVWNEPIWGIQVQQQGNFAQVWANYAFYVNTKFSHCGIDTFQLIKSDGKWKIFYLADTRQRTGCTIPDEVAKQFTN